MCGIVGYFGIDRIKGREFVARGNALIAHRGPDDEGLFVSEEVVLGNRRLAIVDLSHAGHQPMTSPCGRWTIAYNGEVYNHSHLRERYCKDWLFRSRTDTETLLALLALKGTAAFSEMVGMWALAFWDAKEHTLLLARDRYGQKPLYWRACTDSSFRFASEMKPLLEPDEANAMYPPAVAEYLATGNYGHLGDRTFFRDLFSFPPAHWAIISETDRKPQAVRYWRLPIAPKQERRPYDETVCKEFRRAFEDAVASQLMSDVPVGATLSGGLDSSAVVGAMARLGDQQEIPIFTAQTAGSVYDESRYVKAVETHWPNRLRVHWIRSETISLSQSLPEAICTQEEPFGDPSIIAHGVLMRAAKEAGVPVILGGQGGDEILFSYTQMLQSLLASSLRESRVGWVINEARALHLSIKPMLRIGLSAFFPRVEKEARARARLHRRSWLSPALREAAVDGDAKLPAMSDVHAVWLEFIERVALPHLTHYDDRSGMHYSIEGRMPFLDHRLAEIVGALDFTAFLREGRQKYILREACRDLLPEVVLDRRDKIGFHTPMRDLLRAEFKWVHRQLTDEFSRDMKIFQADAVQTALDDLSGGNGAGEASHRVWRALCVRLWAEAFAVSPVTIA